MIRANRENREWENEAWDKQADKVGESREQAQEDPIQKRENGQTDITGKNGNHIELISIIGEIEGHENLSGNTKTTKYEHILPKLAEIEESGETEGVLVLINTVGGDVSCGLALAEMIASLSKPTVSLVLGANFMYSEWSLYHLNISKRSPLCQLNDHQSQIISKI